ncbi:MAG TPA: UDP-2,3-diacylglucosamine diphosphatase, partial [Bacteroidia bacterium]|nr:UDP-2,3-diacylglucosamine diphosphatase [Bacteroidia bacterium]
VITADSDEKFLGEEKEWLFLYAKEHIKKDPIDFFVFGHRHLPLSMNVENKALYVNLGEWINYRSYAVFDGVDLKLEKFNG